MVSQRSGSPRKIDKEAEYFISEQSSKLSKAKTCSIAFSYGED